MLGSSCENLREPIRETIALSRNCDVQQYNPKTAPFLKILDFSPFKTLAELGPITSISWFFTRIPVLSPKAMVGIPVLSEYSAAKWSYLRSL